MVHRAPVKFYSTYRRPFDQSLLQPSRYNKENGHLVGDGPYRLIKPQQNDASAASRSAGPDRAVRSKRHGDGWDCSEAIDHNAGNCVRGAAVIRINPMQEGYEEYDWKNGWSLIESREIVVFGRGVVN
ncbi:MAG: hypothetical protein P8Z37_09665 [Acidobacteriota bacterium]